MWGLLKRKVNLGFIVNPFYLYCVAFSMAIFVYLWGWSNIFPKLSVSLILFFALTFIIFLFAGYKLWKKKIVYLNQSASHQHLNDFIFALIIIIGFLNILLMGYLPILDRLKDYHQFGVPVLDPIFNTLSIFFSVFFFQTFLESKKKRFLVYAIVILIIQILIFRRSTIMWIFTSSSFLFLLYKQRIKLGIILIGIICLPLLSYCFGLYGNTRSNLNQSYIMNDLGASDSFKRSGISHNHYMTYLYVSSPLANLQKNINESTGILNNDKLKDFFFYCIVPQSFTIRLEKTLKFVPPECFLITKDLIVGTFLMVSFYTLGWIGMFMMILFLLFFILLCQILIEKFNTFGTTTVCILATTISLMIFSNFLNRLDVILMLFIYPVLFHIIYNKGKTILNSKHETLNAE
jgi:hypothetical protein